MGRRRALLTDRERELLQSGGDDDEDARYVAISRIRRKIEMELPRDLEILAEHHPQLLDELLEEINMTVDPERYTDHFGDPDEDGDRDA